jgi:hypothetical protein
MLLIVCGIVQDTSKEFQLIKLRCGQKEMLNFKLKYVVLLHTIHTTDKYSKQERNASLCSLQTKQPTNFNRQPAVTVATYIQARMFVVHTYIHPP